MNITLHLNSDMAAKIQALVKITGQDVESVILETLNESLSTELSTSRLPREVWLREFNEYLATMPKGHPSADFSRESAYNGRDE